MGVAIVLCRQGSCISARIIVRWVMLRFFSVRGISYVKYRSRVISRQIWNMVGRRLRILQYIIWYSKNEYWRTGAEIVKAKLLEEIVSWRPIYLSPHNIFDSDFHPTKASIPENIWVNFVLFLYPYTFSSKICSIHRYVTRRYPNSNLQLL